MVVLTRDERDPNAVRQDPPRWLAACTHREGRSTLFVLTGALVLGTGATARVYAAQTTATPRVAADDKALHDRIDEAIEKDATLKDQNIDVEVTNHVVTLTGAVRKR